MLPQELLLCSILPSKSTSAGLTALHDIRTGTSVTSFKQTSPATHCTSLIETKHGLGGIVLTAQFDKALLNIFNFQNDQLMSKVLLPEKLCCIAVDTRGAYCAGGTINGRVYLWQIASGKLFNSFEAHYRRVSVLRFAEDGAALVSTGDDSVVHVWLMSRLLDEDVQHELPTPYCSFSDHTLPITDLLCGVGIFPSCRVLTSSLDRSVKLWDLATCSLLTSFIFSQPITVLALDPSERAFFAASQNGSIFQVNLFRRRKQVTSLRSVESVSGDVLHSETEERLISVNQPVTAMSLSMMTSWLIVGTSEGQILIYDVASHQLLRSIDTYKDKGFTITFLTTIMKPPDLFGHVGLGVSGTARDTCPVRAVAPFHRTKNISNKEGHDVSILLPTTNSVSHPLVHSKEDILEEHRYFVQTSGAVASNGASLQSLLSELEVEAASLREQLKSAKGLNDAMWENIVQKVLTKDDRTNFDPMLELGERTRKRSRIEQ